MEGEALHPTLLATAALGLTAILAWYHRSSSSSKLPLPPGPKKLPLLGNMLDMPTSFQWITFSKWAEQFDSDILHLEVAGVNYIVLNTYEAATDLLDKRSSIYSSRPYFTMLSELVGWTRDFVLMSYGNEWNSHRKLFQQEFHPFDSGLHRPYEKKGLHSFLNKLLDTPEEWHDHTKYLSGEIILGVAYGLDVQPTNDPGLEAANEMMHVFITAAMPGAFLVDSFPILKYIPSWFPGASFQRKAVAWNGIRDATITPPFMKVKEALASGTALGDSFSLRCLQKVENPAPQPDHLSEEEEIIKDVVGTMFEGGTDTGLTALWTFILAMLCFPDAQREAQEELDRVVGGERLPDYEDENLLPYVKAVIYECFRWETVAPFAVPHRVDRDDTYKGYHIPKDSTVIPNVWAMHRDTKTYGPNAHMFEPKRWLLKVPSDKGEGHTSWKLNPDMRDPTSISFGFGRRVCPGKHMALSSLWITATSLLHSFSIMPAIDEDGKPIQPKVEYTSGIQNRPARFQCTIKPRSEGHAALIRQVLYNNME